jgi:hypothetical protein
MYIDLSPSVRRPSDSLLVQGLYCSKAYSLSRKESPSGRMSINLIDRVEA